MTRREYALRATSVLALFVYLFVLVLALASLGGEGLTALTLNDQLWKVVGIAAVFGSLGGLAYDIGTPLLPSPSWKPESFENKTMVPRFRRNNTELEWGFIGPMLVGVVAALVAVFVFTVERPEPSAELISGIEQRLLDGGIPQEDIDSLELAEPLSASIDPSQLVWVSLIAGFAGAVLLRTIGSRMVEMAKTTTLMAGSIAGQTAGATGAKVQEVVPEVIRKSNENAESKVLEALNEVDLSADAAEVRVQLTDAVTQAVEEASKESMTDVTLAVEEISKRAKEAGSEAVTELMEGSSGNPPI